MGRRLMEMKRAAKACVTVVVLGLLATCSNPVDVVAALTDDVKVARNLYLVVDSVTPAVAATNVGPEVRIVIQFDRDVDEATLSPGVVAISPATGWNDEALDLSFEYDSVNRSLAVSHSTFFMTETAYTVTVSGGVLGADSSELRDEVVWSFTTGLVPLGAVAMNGGATYVTNNDDVTLTFTYNELVDKMRYAATTAALESLPWEAASAVPRAYAPAAGEGAKTLYFQFRDENGDVDSPVGGTSIFRDTIFPVAVAAAPAYMNIASPVATLTGTVSDGGSGVGSITWSKTSGPGEATFGSANAAESTVSGSADGTYELTLTVADAAGNTTADFVTITRDIVAPTANAGEDTGWINSPSATYDLNATTSDSGTGIASRLWTYTGPGALELSSTGVEDPEIESMDADGVYTLTLTVTDAAGNSASDTVSVSRDTVAPSVSVVTPKFINLYSPAGQVALEATTSDGTSGVASWSWVEYSSSPSAADVTFQDSGVEDAVVSADQDATFTLRLYVTDVAGNVGVAQMGLMRDTVAPTAPSVVVDESPTLDATPEWSWTAGAGGNGTFRYKLNNSDLTTGATETTSVAYTPSSLSDGTYRLYVQERDLAGNWSSSDYAYTRVTRVLPWNGQTGVSRSPTLEWRASATTYTVYVGRSAKTLIESTPTEDTTLTLHSLIANTTYYWRYKAVARGTTTWYPSSSGTYTFTTGS